MYKRGNGVTVYNSLRRMDAFVPLPSDYGLKAWNGPPHIIGGVAAAVANFYRTKVWIPENTVITNVHLLVGIAGGSVANGYVAVEEISGTDGTRSGVSAALTTVLQSAGEKVIPLAVPIAAQSVGRFVYVLYKVGTATPAPTLAVISGAYLTVGGIGKTAGSYESFYMTDGAPTSAPPAGPTSYLVSAPYYQPWVGIS